MSNPQILRNALVFMGRAQLQGAEAQAFQEVSSWLQDVLAGMERDTASRPPAGLATVAPFHDD